MEDTRLYLDNNELDGIEGEWHGSAGFEYIITKAIKNGAIVKDEYNMRSIGDSRFVGGAYLQKSAAEGVYSIAYYTYYTNVKGEAENVDMTSTIGVLEASKLFTFTKNNGEKVVMVKMYPKNENRNKNSAPSELEKSSGTGFAISSSGYIATNYHVIEGAKSIEVKGVNGNFSRKLSAVVVESDAKNDLAIIKVKSLVP